MTRSALGKVVQKDRAKGKKTFVDVMGLANAKAEAAGLVAQAKADLSPYGAKAELLRQAADFIISRPK